MPAGGIGLWPVGGAGMLGVRLARRRRSGSDPVGAGTGSGVESSYQRIGAVVVGAGGVSAFTYAFGAAGK